MDLTEQANMPYTYLERRSACSVFCSRSIRQPTPASAPRTVPQPVSSRSQIDLRPRPGLVPVGLPMPPAVICHLSVAGTPTTSWFTALFGSQCLLRLSATSAPRALQRVLARGPCPQVLQRHPGVAKGTSIDPLARGPSTEYSCGRSTWQDCLEPVSNRSLADA